MNEHDYEFLVTVYDKEELRRTLSSLSQARVSFKIDDKSNRVSGRAPLSTYVEADLFIAKEDFASALEIIQDTKP